MVFEELLVVFPEEVVKSLTKVITALGGIIFLYFCFQIINFFINQKKLNKIKGIDEKVNRILEILDKKKIKK